MNPLTISIIQTELFWEDVAKNLEYLEEKINSINQKTEVVILPEMFTTGFSMHPQGLAETMDGTAVQWMKRICAQKKIILTGSLMIESDGKYFNRLIWMLPNGQMAFYDKRHLFSFAGEHEHYQAGKKKLLASVNGWKINLQICYDLRFPVWARQPNDPAMHYDILINVANWPEQRDKAWNALLQARAIENQCVVVGVNRVGTDGNGHQYSGNSSLISPLGEIIYRKKNVEDIFTFTLHKEDLQKVRTQFPFLNDADQFRIEE